MAETIWTWAHLDDNALAMVQEAERTLGVAYVLVYGEAEPGNDVPVHMTLPPAPLDASQLECLQGLELAVQGVVVAYRQTV